MPPRPPLDLALEVASVHGIHARAAAADVLVVVEQQHGEPVLRTQLLADCHDCPLAHISFSVHRCGRHGLPWLLLAIGEPAHGATIP